MTEFLATLARLSATRKKRFPLKEAGVGVLMGALIGVGTALSPEWAFWMLLLYFASVQAVALTDNEVFSDFRDFRRLGFREASLSFRVAYMVHYVARDMFIANGVALVLGGTVMVAAGHPWFAVLLWVLAFANVLLIPSHVHLAFRMSERWRIAYIGGMFVAVLALAVPLILGVRVPADALPALPAVCLGITVFHALAVDRIAGSLRGSGLSSFGGRRWFAWLRPVSPFLFKDLLLFHGLAFQSLFMGLSLLAILAMGSPVSSLSGLILLALCHDNVLLARKEGAYRLVSEDTLFREERLPRDRTLLRRSKLRSLAVDLPLKLAIAAILLLASGAFRGDHLAVMAVVLATGFVVDAPLPYLKSRPGVWLRYAATYTGIILFLVVVSFDQPLWLVVVHCLVVAALYLPTFVACYLKPGDAGATPAPTPQTSAPQHREPVPVAA